MLQNQLARGNNGLIKTKYLTFGIDADSIKAAKPRLDVYKRQQQALALTGVCHIAKLVCGNAQLLGKDLTVSTCLVEDVYKRQELARVFAAQYQLTLTEEVEIRYRTDTSTDPETGETTSEEEMCIRDRDMGACAGITQTAQASEPL